jgi:membrane protease subunit (stomatin/prohibitin family)
MREKLVPVFARYGLELDAFAVQNVSLPEELQKILDTKIGMNMIGDMGRYTQYQTANAIPLAAQNEGGLAGLGAGLGAGVGVGQAMAGAMSQSIAPAIAPAAASAAAAPVAAVAAAAVVSADDVVATLEKLHGLVAKGILSQAEFDTKKAELLGKLS